MWRVWMLCKYQIPHVLQSLPAGAPEKAVGFLFASIKQTLFKGKRWVSSLKESFWIFCFVESSGFNQFHHDFSSLRLSKTQIAKHFLSIPFVTQVCKISLQFKIKGIICAVITYPSTNTTKLAAVTIPQPNPQYSSFYLLFKEHPHQIPVHSHTTHTTRQSRQNQVSRKKPCMLRKARSPNQMLSSPQNIF